MYQVPEETSTLPLQPTTFIGREQDIARLRALLQRSEVRLLTLTGPAGVGKTRLSLQVGAGFSAQFPDGVFFVSLASVSHPHQVILTILQAFSLRESGLLPPLSYLASMLKEKNLLLILDNFEHVIEASALVSTLLATCPNLKFLVTSRTVLRLQAEWEFVVSPLSIPPSIHSSDVDHLIRYEAVTLFVARAQAVKADFQVTAATAPTIATICSRLDGLPLAIELAAARCKYFTPSQLLTQLGDALALLSQGAHDLPARQRTLRGAIAWSYQLLSLSEQQLFRRLGIFVGSCDEEAVAYVCTVASSLEIPVLEGMLSLVDKSLLWPVQHDEAEHPRFRMLQLLREFSLEALAQAGEAEVTGEAYATYFLNLAEHESALHESAEQKVWHDRLEQEHSNLQSALSLLLEAAQREGQAQQNAERALRLCLALSEFWGRRGYFREARTFFEQALAYRAGVAKNVQAGALYQLALINFTQDDYEAAETHLTESLALYESLGDKKGRISCLTGFARLALILCEYDTLRTHVAEIASLCQEVGEYSHRALALTFSARAAMLQGAYQEARVLLDESLRLYRAAKDPYALLPQTHLARLLFYSNQDLMQATTLAERCLKGWQEIGEPEQCAALLNLLGQIQLSREEVVKAQALFEQSLAIVEGTLDRAVRAGVLIGLAHVKLLQTDAYGACRLSQQCVTLLQETGSRQILPAALEGWGFALALARKPVSAVQLWGAAEARRKILNITRPPIEQPTYERWMAAGRAQLDEKTWTTALTRGSNMSLDEILAVDCLETDDVPLHVDVISIPPSDASPHLPAGLTVREAEVLRLLAQGLTNAQIAEQLIISPRTVTTHLTSIYNKISVTTRSAATRYAIENHLV